MKKIVITMALTALVGTSYGQGFVTVAGTMQSSTNNTSITSAWTGGTLAGGGALGNVASGQSYRMALLSSTAGSPVLNLYGDATLGTDWLYTGLLGANNTFAGRMTIGSGLATAAGTGTIGVSQNWLLVAWSTSLGTTWAGVASQLAAGDFNNVAGFIGWSAVGVGAASAAAPAPALSVQFTSGSIIPAGFSLLATPVPEPSTMALAGLAGLSLLLFRRRK